MTGNNELLVLILILLEVTQIIIRELYLLPLIRLNPYSTGSNSNDLKFPFSEIVDHVLILILLEVTQIL